MNRANSRRSSAAEVGKALDECFERLADMKSGQERFCAGKRLGSEPNRRRGLRKFTEAHVAFLNAAYSAGDYLMRAVSAGRRDDVSALLAEPNQYFHRQLRNTVDHSERPEYTVSFSVNQVLALTAPRTFPHPDLRIAMMHGFVDVETGLPKVGDGYVTYAPSKLAPNDAKNLALAMQALDLKGDNPSVLFMAERCYERLLAFNQKALRDDYFD